MGPRVLVCDDAPGYRLLLGAVLEEAGFALAGEAGDWASAVALAERERPDAVVLDLWLPTFVVEQVARVRAAAPEAVLVVVSALARDDASAAVAGVAGVDAVVSKRSPTADVVAALRERL